MKRFPFFFAKSSQEAKSGVQNGIVYEFSEFRLIPDEDLLLRNGDPVPLPPKAYETLVLLIKRRGHLVKKAELIESVWSDAFVEEAAVSKCVWMIRNALGEDSKSQRFIQTVPKRGYRFVAEVTKIEPTSGVENGKFDRYPNANGSSATAQESQPTLTESGAHAVVSLAEWRRLFAHPDAHQELPSDEDDGPGVDGEADAAKQPASVDRPTLKPAEVNNWREYALFAVALFAIGTTILYLTSTGPPAGGAVTGNQIAVLPIKPVDSANRSEILEIGVTGSLINRLNSIEGFVARPLSATHKYDALDQDPLAAGREQKVDHVIDSTYQLADGKFRITAKLINVASGVAEDTYPIETAAGDIFALQDAVTDEIAKWLTARFDKATVTTTTKRGTNNKEAYRLYLQGRNLTMRRSGEGHKKAIEYFEQAIKIDPNFALAYARMAHAYFGSAAGDRSDGAEKAKGLIRKALELDPNLAEAYAIRGHIGLAYEWNFEAAENDLRRAIELEPNNDTAHWLYGLLLTNRGHFDEGLREMEAAVAIDPGAFVYMCHRGRILYYARRYAEAITQYQHAIDLDDRSTLTYSWMVRVYETNGDHETAFRYFLEQEKRSARKDQLDSYTKAYETSGWLGVRQVADTNGRFFDLARLHSLRGEKDAAFENLNKAVEQRHWMMTTLNVEPAFDNLRGDPRYGDLLKRVGY